MRWHQLLQHGFVGFEALRTQDNSSRIKWNHACNAGSGHMHHNLKMDRICQVAILRDSRWSARGGPLKLMYRYVYHVSGQL